MKERFAKGLATLLQKLGAGKLASAVLSSEGMKHDPKTTQAAIEAIRAARAATDAATEAVNAAAAALNAASAKGNSSTLVMGAPHWNPTVPPAPECPSVTGKSRKIRGFRGFFSRR